MRARRLEKFIRLPAAERWLLVRSVLVLGTARVALWLLPLRVARRLVSRTARPTSPARMRHSVGWAIAVAQRIGATKSGDGELEAHAWVESGGHIVVGELSQGLSHYTFLPPLPDPRD